MFIKRYINSFIKQEDRFAKLRTKYINKKEFDRDKVKS